MLKMQQFSGNSGSVAHPGSLSWDSRNPGPQVRTWLARSPGAGAHEAGFSSFPMTQGVLLGHSLDTLSLCFLVFSRENPLIRSPHAIIVRSNMKKTHKNILKTVSGICILHKGIFFPSCFAHSCIPSI